LCFLWPWVFVFKRRTVTLQGGPGVSVPKKAPPPPGGGGGGGGGVSCFKEERGRV